MARPHCRTLDTVQQLGSGQDGALLRLPLEDCVGSSGLQKQSNAREGERDRSLGSHGS